MSEHGAGDDTETDPEAAQHALEARIREDFDKEFSPEYLAQLRARAESASVAMGSGSDPVELIWMAFAHGWSHGRHAGTQDCSIGAPAAQPGTQV